MRTAGDTKRRARCGAVLTGAILVLALLVDVSAAQGRADNASAQIGGDAPKLVVPHTPSPKDFPCSKCHRHVKPNPQKRALELAHTAITLKHAETQRWCFDCHDGDRLRLPNGELVDYDRSWVLCGQCHGTVARDWKAGIHGTRTGEWNGERYYRVCVSCHNPHQPRFKAIAPKPAPVRPADLGRGLSR